MRDDESIQRMVAQAKRVIDIFCEWGWLFVLIVCAIMFIGVSFWLLRLLSPLVILMRGLARIGAAAIIGVARLPGRCYAVINKWIPPRPPQKMLKLSLDANLVRTFVRRALEEGRTLEDLIEDAMLYFDLRARGQVHDR
jgi:hypothetical protein